VRDFSRQDLARRPVTVLTDPFYRIDILTVAWSVHYAEARAEATPPQLLPFAALPGRQARSNVARRQA
jgi:hypothetical protein